MKFSQKHINKKTVSRYILTVTLSAMVLLQTASVGVFASLIGGQAKIDTGWTDTGNITINIDTAKDKTPISPYIYGLCADDSLTDVKINATNQSGAALSSYNWESNFSNSTVSGNNMNDLALVRGYAGTDLKKPALSADNLMTKADRYRIPGRFLTLQMMGYVAKDANGRVLETDEISDRFDTISFDNPEGYSTQPDLNDGIVYIDEYVSYLVNKYSQASNGGIDGYFLDYEPENWSKNYPVLNLPALTPKSLVEKSGALAKSVKSIDRTALVFGPSINGLESYVNLGNTDEWRNYSDSYSWFIDYYLDNMSIYSQATGYRLLDVLDLHFISEAKDSLMEPVVNSNTIFSNAARMQATRILWDSSYTENSFSAIQYKQNTPIIPTVQASIRMYYPGTRLSFSEYNFGGGKHISGAIAEADVLGIFATQNVYMASLKPNTSEYPYQKAAINMYTNYDDLGSSFGDTLVKSTNDGDNMSSVYSAIDSKNESLLKTILINKNGELKKKAKVNISSSFNYSAANVYCLNSETSDIIFVEHFDDIENNSFEYEMNPLSIYLFEFESKDIIIDTPNITTPSPIQTSVPDETSINLGSSSSVSDIVISSEIVTKESDTENSGSEESTEKSEVTTTSVKLVDDTSYNEDSEESQTTRIEENLDNKGGVPFAVKVIIGVLVAAVFFGMGYVLLYDKK